MRRVGLMLSVMAALLAVTAGVAVAATITCTTTSLCKGGSKDDTLTGNQLNNWIEGRGGRDVIKGKLGNDQLYGGQKDLNTGASVLSGTADSSTDTIHGGQGDDKVYGGKGSDRLRDLSGLDTIKNTGAEDTDSIYGEDGDDLLNVTDGETKDTVDGGSGTDTCYVDQEDPDIPLAEDGAGGNNDKYKNCETVNPVVGATANNAADA